MKKPTTTDRTNRPRKTKKPKKTPGVVVGTAVTAGRYAGFYHS